MRIMVAGKLSARDYIPQSGKYAGERRTYEEVMAEYLAVMPPVEQFAQEKEYHPEVAQWERNLYPDVTF